MCCGSAEAISKRPPPKLHSPVAQAIPNPVSHCLAFPPQTPVPGSDNAFLCMWLQQSQGPSHSATHCNCHGVINRGPDRDDRCTHFIIYQVQSQVSPGLCQSLTSAWLWAHELCILTVQLQSSPLWKMHLLNQRLAGSDPFTLPSNSAELLIFFFN